MPGSGQGPRPEQGATFVQGYGHPLSRGEGWGSALPPSGEPVLSPPDCQASHPVHPLCYLGHPGKARGHPFRGSTSTGEAVCTLATGSWVTSGFLHSLVLCTIRSSALGPRLECDHYKLQGFSQPRTHCASVVCSWELLGLAKIVKCIQIPCHLGVHQVCTTGGRQVPVKQGAAQRGSAPVPAPG